MRNNPVASSKTTPADVEQHVIEVVRLREGSTVTVRPVRARDEPALRSFLLGLSLEAKRLRFFTGGPDVSFAAHLAGGTDAGRHGLVAHDEAGALVARVLPENRAMLGVFCDGFHAQVRLYEESDTVEFPTASWRLARERFSDALPHPSSAQPAEILAARDA